MRIIWSFEPCSYPIAFFASFCRQRRVGPRTFRLYWARPKLHLLLEKLLTLLFIWEVYWPNLFLGFLLFLWKLYMPLFKALIWVVSSDEDGSKAICSIDSFILLLSIYFHRLLNLILTQLMIFGSTVITLM